jgi:monoamine oxidase
MYNFESPALQGFLIYTIRCIACYLNKRYCMQQELYDVVIIGAGAAGLMAAWELALVNKKVVVAEAKDRVGGRIHTLESEGFAIPIELGAEFVHGKLRLTQWLLKRAGIESYKVSGDLWRKEEKGLDKEGDFIEDQSLLHKKFKQLKGDIPVADFLNQYLSGPEYEELRTSLKTYVEGYYAADTTRASTYTLRDELAKADTEQYRIEGGYQKLIDFLIKELGRRAGSVLLSAPALHINWQSDPIEVHTEKGRLYGKKVILTLPLGVLQSGQPTFTPAIPDKVNAAKALGFGSVIKVLLQFSRVFWKQKEHTAGKDLSGAGFIFSEEEIPTWWTAYPKDVPMLVGWLGGPNADKIKRLSEEDILQKALVSLGNIFTIGQADLMRILSLYRVYNWAMDPYCRGGYSYEVVGGREQKQKLKEPLEGRIFFAGEGLYEGVEVGTVEAALVNGRETAHQVIAAF